MVKLAQTSKREFVDTLVRAAEETVAPKIIPYEDEPVSPLDDATQKAQAYWMMGWSWEEIDSVLVDMEFPQSTVNKAIENTKEYAKTILNKGPFSVIKEGQLVRLHNGNFAKVVTVTKNSCTLYNDQEKKFTASAKQIDLSTVKELAIAYLMRQAATKVLHLVARSDYKIPDAPQDAEMVDVQPGTPDTFTVKFPETTPGGYADITPELGEVEPVSPQLAKIINNLQGLKEMRKELESTLKKLKADLEPIASQIKDLKVDEQTEVRNLFMVFNQITEGLKGVDDIVFGEYAGQVAMFQQKVVDAEDKPGVQDELDALKYILTENHPKIAKPVFEALDQYMKTSTTIDHYVDHLLAVYPFRKNRRKGKRIRIQGQWVTKVKNFFKSVLDRLMGVTEEVLNVSVPLAAETAGLLAQFNKAASVMCQQRLVNAMMNRKGK